MYIKIEVYLKLIKHEKQKSMHCSTELKLHPFGWTQLTSISSHSSLLFFPNSSFSSFSSNNSPRRLHSIANPKVFAMAKRSFPTKDNDFALSMFKIPPQLSLNYFFFCGFCVFWCFICFGFLLFCIGADLQFESPLEIVKYPDPRLRVKNKPISTFDDNLKKLVDEMFDVMYK